SSAVGFTPASKNQSTGAHLPRGILRSRTRSRPGARVGFGGPLVFPATKRNWPVEGSTLRCQRGNLWRESVALASNPSADVRGKSCPKAATPHFPGHGSSCSLEGARGFS